MPEFGEPGYGMDPNTFYGSGSTSNAAAFAASLGVYKEIKDTELAIVKNREGLRLLNNALDGFAGMMETATSAGNVFSSLDTQLRTFFSDMGGAFTEGAENALGDLGDVLTGFAERIGRAIGKTLEGVFDGLAQGLSHWNNNVFPNPQDPFNPSANMSWMDAVAQGVSWGILGMPFGFFNFFSYLFSLPSSWQQSYNNQPDELEDRLRTG